MVTIFLLRELFKIQNNWVSTLIACCIIAAGGILYFILKTRNIKTQLISTVFYFVGILAIAFFYVRNINSDRKIVAQTYKLTFPESEYQRLIGEWKTSQSDSHLSNVTFTDDSLTVIENEKTHGYLYGCVGELITAYKNDSVRFIWNMKEVTDQNLVLLIGGNEIRFMKEL